MLNSGSSHISNPNFIFILADDMGIGRFKIALEDLSSDQFDPKILERDKNRYTGRKAYIDAKRSIPNLTNLAKEGIYFNNAFANSPWCSPSRISILTGQYPQRLGAWISNDLRASDITKNANFLSANLKGKGYTNSYIGKWHLGNNRFRGGLDNNNHPLDKGFDEFWGFDFSGSRYYNSEIMLSGRDSTHTDGFLTDQFTSKALSFLQRQTDENPFFLMLSYNAPHGPLDLAPFEYYQEFGSRENYFRNDVKNKEVTDTRGPSMANNYNAHILAMDKGIGRIVDYLKSSGLDSNTVVVFSSDHGASGFETTPLPANSPYLGYKGQYFQGSLRVPLIFWNPHHLQAGTSSILTMGFDILPTLLSMAGIENNLKDVDGKDLSKVVYHGSEKEIHEHLIWAGKQTTHQAIETDRGSLDEVGVWCITDSESSLRHTYNSGFELYDITDIKEANNLANTANKDQVYELTKKYNEWFNEVANEPIYFKNIYDEVNMSNMQLLEQ